ncbi:extracellular solute-binding protein [Hahella sp. KA22]|uniref:ABC transporter substrate-binding protein n=1 Tax=Hahella sp. KA22 TaxID=1628392 RepID=UPI000FDD50E6|nr:ABC transporter substrate-binding protein [Hahella sp. KA22]AZZ94091.1 ABC transporter substrate-binding protein [Hahella sp. KA22]QAY57465.1 extracellular solute-binding protein [Hahella sp. KA22]
MDFANRCRHFRRLLSLTVLLAPLSFAQGAELPAEAASQTGPATKPLILYSVLSEYPNVVSYAFTRKTGIPVEIIEMRGSGAAMARLQYERRSGNGDIWFGGSLGSHIQAGAEGYLVPYVSPQTTKLEPLLGGPFMEGTVNGLYGGILGIVVSKPFLQERGAPIPQTWKDLADPVYRDMIGMKSPLVSGTAFTTLISMIALMGEDAAFDYFKALHQNVEYYGKGQTYRVSTGQIGIVITFYHEVVKSIEDGDVAFIVPPEGVGYEIGGLSIIKHDGQDVQKAQAFIDFALSWEGQSLIKNAGSDRIPTYSKLYKEQNQQIKLQDVKLLPLDFEWAGINRQRLLDRWTQEVASQEKKR